MSGSAAAPPAVWRPTGLLDWLTTVDHKKIGLMYFWFVVAAAILGGLLAGLIRVQLALPGAALESLNRAALLGQPALSLFSDEHGVFAAYGTRHLYDQMVTMHASLMIFFVLIPGFVGMANYIVPLLIGARDMAFPKLNALGFWLLVPAILLQLASFFVSGGAAASGWTAYPPLSLLSASPGPGQDMWVLGIHLAGISSIIAGINFIVTITSMRAPGMTWLRLPLFAWSTYFTSWIQLLATPVLAAAVTMILLDRRFGTTFTVASQGGDPVLYQHIFWFYSHPAVYIMILPGFGAISHVIAAFSRKRVFGYVGMFLAIGAIAFIGFGVWAHHMFTVGMPSWAQLAFAYASMLIAVPTGIKVFNWIATMWGGTIRFTTAMKFACGFVSMFVFGGFGGLFLALVPFDVQVHDSYFVVGHFHLTMVGGSVMLLFAMTYYWWPKMSGRMLDERQGTWIFWLMLSGIVIAFMTMHLTGALGMPRRIAVYYQDFRLLNIISTIGYALTFVAACWFVVDLLRSYRRPRVTEDDPWHVNDVQRSFEWATSCPPPPYNFAAVPPIPVADQVRHDDPLHLRS